jgi:hypothetical protein
VTWPLQILENQLYVSAAHIDIDFAAFVQVLVRVYIGTSGFMEFPA